MDNILLARHGSARAEIWYDRTWPPMWVWRVSVDAWWTASGEAYQRQDALSRVLDHLASWTRAERQLAASTLDRRERRRHIELALDARRVRRELARAAATAAATD